MKKILIDVDGTIIKNHMHDLCKEYLGHEIDLSKIPKGMYLNNYFMSKEFKKYFEIHNLYEYGYIFPDCKKVIELLNKKYDIMISTGWIFYEMEDLIGIIIDRKYNFLINTFPFLKASQLDFSGSKTFFAPDIAIGDTIYDLVGTELNILITDDYQEEDYKDINNLKVVSSWNEIEKLLIS